MTDIDLHHLSAAYAVDALDERERVAFEAHYGACDVCRIDVLEFHRTLTQVAGSLAAAPPASLKSKVMAEVAVTRQLSPSLAQTIDLAKRRRMRTVTTMMVAAAALAMIVVTVVAMRGRGGNYEYSDDLARVMEQPDSRLLSLENKSGTEGSFKVAWSSSLGQAVLIGEDLPAAPDDKAYELWLITPDQTMAMYVLDQANDGDVHRTLKTSADPTAWAITVEPAGGSPTATGDIIYTADV